MKKILALALAVVMMMAIALPTFAVAAEADPTTSTRYGDGNDDSASANYLEDAEDSQKEQVEIKYGVAQAYTVTIPEGINLHQYNGNTNNAQVKGYVYSKQIVTVEDVVVAKGEYLNIYLSSKNTSAKNRTWKLKDTMEDLGGNTTTGSEDVEYQVKSGPAMASNYYFTGALTEKVSGIENGGAILTCEFAKGNAGTTGSTANVGLFFSSKGTAQEGTYVDLLTFTVKIETAAATIQNTAPVEP